MNIGDKYILHGKGGYIMSNKDGRIILSSPLDSGNRGCEGICRGVAQIMQLPVNKLVTITSDAQTDKRVKLNKYITLKTFSEGKKTTIERVLYLIGSLFIRDRNKKQCYDRIYNEYLAHNDIKKEDLVLCNGGDTFCYTDNESIFLNNILHRKGIKTVLLTCSMGRKNLTKEKYKSLNNFEVLIARESLTATFFKKLLPHKQVYCIPDPAFVLAPERCNLPAFMQMGDTVGINLSNFVNQISPEKYLIFKKNINVVIEYILRNTNYNVVLIPHVFWKREDDRVICRQIAEEYKDEERVHYYNTFDLNYEQIRYIISNCRFFVGARTHAMVSAYAMSVPALALGYSIKSRGIARDIGLDPRLVINCKDLQYDNELKEAFCFLMEKEDEIRLHYENNLQSYIDKAYRLKDILNQL